MAKTVLGIGGFFLSDSSCGICLANISKRHFELCHKLGFKRIYVIPSNFEEEGSVISNNFSSAIEYIKKRAELKCTDVAKRMLLYNNNANVNLNYNMNNLCINYNYANGSINYNYCGGNISYSISNSHISSNLGTSGNRGYISNQTNGCINYISNNITTNDHLSCSQTIISNNNMSMEQSQVSVNNNNCYNGRNVSININNNNNNNNNNCMWLNNTERNVQPPHIIIGTHTIVEVDGDIFEIPKDEEDAYNMLCRLSDRVHNVHTAVAICTKKKGSEMPAVVFVETTKVDMQKLNERDINAYLKTDEPYSNVGAYSIAGTGAQIIKSIDGCFYNILGLPVHTLSYELAKLYNSQNICDCQ